MLTLNGGTLATTTGTSSFAGAITLMATGPVSVTGTQLTLSGVIDDLGGDLGLTKTQTLGEYFFHALLIRFVAIMIMSGGETRKQQS